METVGRIKLKTKLLGTDPEMSHEFQVLNIRSYRSIIFGRDFLKRYKTAEFDFLSNKIKISPSSVIGTTDY